MSKSWAPAPADRLNATTKVRVRGADPGSPAFNAVLDRFRGEIGQFLNSQHQQVQLSGQRVYKASIEWDGARATYQHNNGQDTLYIDVRTESGGGEEFAESRDYWSWALVEMVIPNLAAKTTAELSAFLPEPLKGDVVYARFNHGGDNSSDNILRYGDFGWDEQIGGTNTPTDIVASLLIDLRKFRNDGGLSVDLYGYLDPFDQLGLPADPTWPYEVVGSTRWAHWGRDASPYTAPFGVAQVSRGPGNIAVSDSLPTIYDALIASFPELTGKPYVISAGGGSWNDGKWGPFVTTWDRLDHPGMWWSDTWLTPQNLDPNELTSLFPSSYSDVLDYWDAAHFYRKTETRSGVTGNAPDGSAWTSNVIPTTHDDGSGNIAAWSLSLYDYIDYFIPTCHVVPTLDARIRVVFLGKEADATSYWSGDATDFYQWEIASIYPERPHLKELPDTALLVGMDTPDDTSFANHFGEPKLGTLHINPNKATGGFKFKRA